jgi:hypothetical protein
LIGVEDDLEAVPVHSAALVAGFYVGEPVGRLEDVATPDVRVIVAVEVNTFVGRAEHTDLEEPWHVKTAANPAGEIFVCWLVQTLVQMMVVERLKRCGQAATQFINFATRE